MFLVSQKLTWDQAVPHAAPAQGRQRQEDYLSQIFPVNRDNTAESNRTIMTSQARLWGTVQDCRLKNKKSPATQAQHREDKGRAISVYSRPGRIHAEILSQKSTNSRKDNPPRDCLLQTAELLRELGRILRMTGLNQTALGNN